MNPGVTCLDWEKSSGQLESWEGLLLVTDDLTSCAEAIFRVKWTWKFQNSGEQFDWSIDRVTVGKPVMWLAYIGETSRNLTTWVNKQKPATKKGDLNNNITKHHLKISHTIDSDSAMCIS